MFTRDGVTLRPLEPSDVATMYAWHLDYELDILSSWGVRRSWAQYEKRWETKISEPEEDMIYFGIVHGDKLVGRVQLALIDREQRRASVGIVIGDRRVWGKGVARRALQMMYDYAFTVENLERLYAEVYGFNIRSLRMVPRTGMQPEGILRGHELHNGTRQDVHMFGLLRDEFYRQYETMFKLPES